MHVFVSMAEQRWERRIEGFGGDGVEWTAVRRETQQS